ncbi:MAG: V-type ATPase subunit [Methanospirillum sp.]|nr:V-type ATPase subunit [Methanospirillum sp.]
MDQGYINARVRGMYRTLLGPDALRNLILVPDLDAMISELQKTPYREELETSCVRRSSVVCIEDALRRHLARVYSKILAMFDDQRESREARYVRIFLNRWDVHNLKTILRGKSIRSSPEEIREALVPAGTLDEATLVELLKQNDVRQVIDLLATWNIDYAKALTPNIDEWSRSGQLLVLEHALDRYYFQYARDAVRGRQPEAFALQELVGTEIDVTNLKTVITFIRDGIDLEDGERFLLEGGGELTTEVLSGMVSDGNLGKAGERLEGTRFISLRPLLTEAQNSGRFSPVMKELDWHLIRAGASLFRRDPLSITVVIGFLYRFLIEVTNIRIIARCRDAGLSDEELEAELIHV